MLLLNKTKFARGPVCCLFTGKLAKAAAVLPPLSPRGYYEKNFHGGISMQTCT
jgi:hypothetical protein